MGDSKIYAYIHLVASADEADVAGVPTFTWLFPQHGGPIFPVVATDQRTTLLELQKTIRTSLVTSWAVGINRAYSRDSLVGLTSSTWCHPFSTQS